MFIKNNLQWMGKTLPFLLSQGHRVNRGSIYFSSSTKISEIVTPKLSTLSSINANLLSPPSMTERCNPLKQDPQNQLHQLPAQESGLDLSEDDKEPWLRALIEKGVVAPGAGKKYHALRKYNSILDKERGPPPMDFIQVHLEKAEDEDFSCLEGLIDRNMLAPEIEAQIDQKYHEQVMAQLALEYPNPELDEFIKLHHGKIENIEAFDIDELENRAERGLLDQETALKVHAFKKAYYDQIVFKLVENDKVYQEKERDDELEFKEHEISWLRPFVRRGIVDAQAEEKCAAIAKNNQMPDPADFIQINFDKATKRDLWTIDSFARKNMIDPKVRKRIDKIFYYVIRVEKSLQYPNPQLDEFIKLHQGSIENFEDFDIYELENRADQGLLDRKTTRRLADNEIEYEIESIKDALEDEWEDAE
ncbi:MAG: hypothetical protein QRY72_02030 [Candidatus Rhabdochlamydia sp.]